MSMPSGSAIPLPDKMDNHFFISHCQSTGGDQANAIYLELERIGFACWYDFAFVVRLSISKALTCFVSRYRRYDNRASDLTKEGMRQGIVDSGAFIVFLSAGILVRPFCKSIASFSAVKSV
jgi:hypothetical protein